MLGDNQKVSRFQASVIRALDDFDLTMLISEIHDHGWEVAKRTLEMMPTYKELKAAEHLIEKGEA